MDTQLRPNLTSFRFNQPLDSLQSNRLARRFIEFPPSLASRRLSWAEGSLCTPLEIQSSSRRIAYAGRHKKAKCRKPPAASPSASGARNKLH